MSTLDLPVPKNTQEVLRQEYGEDFRELCKTHFWNHKWVRVKWIIGFFSLALNPAFPAVVFSGRRRPFRMVNSASTARPWRGSWILMKMHWKKKHPSLKKVSNIGMISYFVTEPLSGLTKYVQFGHSNGHYDFAICLFYISCNNIFSCSDLKQKVRLFQMGQLHLLTYVKLSSIIGAHSRPINKFPPFTVSHRNCLAGNYWQHF